MHKLISVFILLSTTVLTTIPVMAGDKAPGANLLFSENEMNASGTGQEPNFSSMDSILCRSGKCDIYKNFSTSQKCVASFDQYFDMSGGEMPPCIPRFTNIQIGDPFPKNELFCYANWKVQLREECDPVFDPAVDEYEVINEAYGNTPYEICLLNKAAMVEVCTLTLMMYCTVSCQNKYIHPCFQEYEMTGDSEALAECLADVQPKVDKCEKKKTDCNSYILSTEPSN